MKMLSLDTSTNRLSLAVSVDQKVVSSCNEVLANKISKTIIPRINKICKKAGVELVDIDVIAAGIGPGSFTSLRVGLATVKGLVFGTKKRIIGVPSLDVIALNVKNEEADVCVISDAKRKMVYFARYKKLSQNIKQVGSYQLIPVEKIKELNLNNITIVGDGIPLIRDYFQKDSNSSIEWKAKQDWYPSARHLASLASQKLEEKGFTNINQLLPLYLYAQDCQVRK